MLSSPRQMGKSAVVLLTLWQWTEERHTGTVNFDDMLQRIMFQQALNERKSETVDYNYIKWSFAIFIFSFLVLFQRTSAESFSVAQDAFAFSLLKDCIYMFHQPPPNERLSDHMIELSCPFVIGSLRLDSHTRSEDFFSWRVTSAWFALKFFKSSALCVCVCVDNILIYIL